MTHILPLNAEVRAEQIVQLAEQRLRNSPYFFLRKLRCRYESGTLVLRGQVPYWQLREFAEAIVSRVDGVERVSNCIEVFDPMAGPSGAAKVRSAG